MKFENTIRIESLKNKLNDLLNKHQEKKNEINLKITKTNDEIQKKAIKSINLLTRQQSEILFDLNETKYDLELKLNELKHKHNSNESLKELELFQNKIKKLKGISFNIRDENISKSVSISQVIIFYFKFLSVINLKKI